MAINDNQWLAPINDNSIRIGTGTGYDPNLIGGGSGGIFPHSTPPVIPCQHLVSDFNVWDDGKVVGICSHCSERITFATIPGGVGAVRIRRVLEEITAPAIASISEYLDEIDYIEALIDIELEEIEMAKKRAIISRKILLDRLSKANAKAMDTDL